MRAPADPHSPVLLPPAAPLRVGGASRCAQAEQGYVLLCCAYPEKDCEVNTIEEVRRWLRSDAWTSCCDFARQHRSSPASITSLRRRRPESWLLLKPSAPPVPARLPPQDELLELQLNG